MHAIDMRRLARRGEPQRVMLTIGGDVDEQCAFRNSMLPGRWSSPGSQRSSPI
jgi:hypothetical protein